MSSSLSNKQPFSLLENTYVVFLIALVLTFILYSSGLNDPPLFDDFFFDIFYRDKGAFQLTIHPRVLEEGSIVWIRHINDGLPTQRVVNWIIHAINVTLLAGLCARVLEWLIPASDDRSRKITLASFMAAMIFLVHPVAIYSVAYLNQRSTEMAATGMLFTLLLFWNFLREEAPRRQWGFVLLATLTYLLTLFCKEHAIMVPAVCMVLMVMHDGGFRRQRLAPVTSFLVLCALIAWVVVIRSKGQLVLGQAPEYSAAKMMTNYTHLVSGFDPKKMMIYSVQTQASLFFKYCYLWVVPNPAEMSVDIRIPAATAVISSYTLGAIAYVIYGIAAAGLLLFGKTRFQRFLAFSLLVPWVMFWTEFTSLRLQEIFVLYRAYLWFIAITPLLALLFCSFGTRFSVVVWPVMFIVLAIAAHNRIDTFSTEVALWQDAADLVEQQHFETRQPGIERIYYNLGTAQFNIGMYDDAKTNLLYAYHYLPVSEFMGRIMFNLALTYKRLEDYPDAVKVYRPLVALEPSNDGAWWLMGVSMEKMGDMVNAHDAYEHACKLKNPYACERLKPGGHI